MTSVHDSSPETLDNGGWTSISKDPVASSVAEWQSKTLGAIKRVETARSFREFLVDDLSNKTVLDIGMVEHDLGHASSPDWLHDLVVKSAHEVLGVDIAEEEVRALQARGYNIRVADATSDLDLGQRFQSVLIAEVVEHVDDPVRLLRFAGRHLDIGGEILVKTPNPWFAPYVLRAWRSSTFIANAEHVSWITPSNMLEIVRRAGGLELVEYSIFGRPNHSSRMRRLAMRGVSLLTRGSESVSPFYVYRISRVGESTDQN